MPSNEVTPQPVINDYNTVVSRPAFRAVAYAAFSDEAYAGMARVIELLRGPLRDRVTVCSGAHLRPKDKRHKISAADLGQLSAILEPKAHFSSFMLFGDASLDDAAFALPLFRVLRDSDGFTIEFAFRPDVDVDAVKADVWPAIRALAPDYTYLGWGVLPFAAGHEHERRVTARHKARYRASACLDAKSMADVVLSEDLAKKHTERSGSPTEVGVYDLGWRTILGPRFLRRVDRAVLGASGASIEDLPGDCVEIVLGDRPTWGDVNAGDAGADVRKAVLKALRPIMASKSMALKLGGLDDTTEAADILDMYFADWN